MHIFKVFWDGLFFEPETTFERPRSPKESRKGAKMEAQATLEALSGKCKKHGRRDDFNTLGDLGERPGSDFFQSGSPDPFWKDPGEHFGRFFSDFGGLWRSV